MHRSNESQVWVVIPAFNEARVIADTVTHVLDQVGNLVVIDDCSTDATASLASDAGAHVLSHPINLGQGAALQTGIAYALQHGAQYVVTFDADGQHDAREIEPMLKALQASGCDVALGSRFLGKASNLAWQRRLLLSFALLFTRISTRLRLTDVHNGFRILTRSFCELFEFQQNRMAHASEILEYIALHHVNYIEHPVTIIYSDYSVRKGQKGFDAFRILMELLMARVGK